MDKLRKYYTTVYAQCFSPCHKYLTAANNYGEIAVFAVSDFLSNDDGIADDCRREPMYKFQAHSNTIYSMVMSEDFVISGGNGEIFAWDWSAVKKKSAKLAWSLTIPQGESLLQPEINALVLTGKDSEQRMLLAGCGDNKIYAWDIETRTLLHTLTGHTDYIHGLALTSSNLELYSASEDGSVKQWDLRNPTRPVSSVEPYKNEELQRPLYGKWIGCVALDSNDDWMICGGGPMLCIWHISSSSPVTPLSSLTHPATVAMFYDDMVLAAGNDPSVYHWSFNGDLKARVETSASNLYSVVINDNPLYKALCAGGSSYKIEVCTNFMYRDFSLIF